ncbi:MAG: family 20 glycosylhydrolase [Bacteroidales bacterium]|nr:family 20 glycosylhydrolase [Bacteroidales bacterium]
MKSLRHLSMALTLAALFSAAPALAQQSNPVVPRPISTTWTDEGAFQLTEKSAIACDAALEPQARYLQETFAASTGYNLAVIPDGKGKICLTVDTLRVPKAEGYVLEVTRKGISICGHDAAGVFYGIQTLLQHFPASIHSDKRQKGVDWTVPALRVEDAPERPWRGMMLDAARYYYDKSFVLKFIDMMAMYKLNKLQFHFIDDSGWRLEIKKYPRLTEVGAWAGSDEKRTGGYYTQDDIREIVAYAAVRGVEIIPEIEFPAHILSAVVAYPWLCCTGLQHEVPQQHFISRDLLCVGKESSLRFLRDVLDETVALFPSSYINIGGDEAVYTRWEKCPDCQALMKREGLTEASQLQGWLTNVVAGWMKERGRTVIGWEEIMMRGKVETPVVALIWHNVADSIHATAGGHKAIITPASHLYFDFPETSTPGEPQHATWMPPISLEKAYTMPVNDYDPTSTTLGVQGCIWSDQFIHGTRLQEILPIDEDRSERYVEYFVFPRLLALSELGWDKADNRDFADFTRRLTDQFARLDAKNCSYRVPEPRVTSLTENADGSYTYRLAPSVTGAAVRYTTDGTYPTVHSTLYAGEPVTVKRKSDLCAITVVTPTHYSLPLYTAPDYSAYSQYGTYTTSWQPLQVQTVPTPWRIECTGKISDNGRYEVSFIGERGTAHLRLGDLKVYKRDELIATVSQSATADPAATYAFTVDSFEAGTPFFIEVTASGDNGNDTSGLVFIKKAE